MPAGPPPAMQQRTILDAVATAPVLRYPAWAHGTRTKRAHFGLGFGK